MLRRKEEKSREQKRKEARSRADEKRRPSGEELLVDDNTKIDGQELQEEILKNEEKGLSKELKTPVKGIIRKSSKKSESASPQSASSKASSTPKRRREEDDDDQAQTPCKIIATEDENESESTDWPETGTDDDEV